MKFPAIAPVRVVAAVVTVAAALAATACAPADDRAGDVRNRSGEAAFVVVNAGSLARPLRTALSAFAGPRALVIHQENAGSLEAARKLTELGQIPDFIALADFEVFPALLMPRHVSWYVQFARNRMVLVYAPRSRFAGEIASGRWWEVVQRAGVEVGRADPALDPAGYRALLLFQLAERHLSIPGLASRLEAAAPMRNVRPKAADLVALLQVGEIDYFWGYESFARAADLPFLPLPPEIDLGSPAHAALYEHARIRIPGKTPADTLEVRGEPILYAFSIPIGASSPAAAEAFGNFLLSQEGRRLLRAEHLHVLDDPILVGVNAPESIRVATTREPPR